jgi:hypothetical protein
MFVFKYCFLLCFIYLFINTFYVYIHLLDKISTNFGFLFFFFIKLFLNRCLYFTHLCYSFSELSKKRFSYLKIFYNSLIFNFFVYSSSAYVICFYDAQLICFLHCAVISSYFNFINTYIYVFYPVFFP